MIYNELYFVNTILRKYHSFFASDQGTNFPFAFFNIMLCPIPVVTMSAVLSMNVNMYGNFIVLLIIWAVAMLVRGYNLTIIFLCSVFSLHDALCI